MSYADSQGGGLVKDAAAAATIPAQTPADKSTWHVLEPTTVYRLSALVTLAMTVTDAIFALDRRVLAGSDTGRVELGRITIPAGTAAGKVVYKDLVAQDLDAGDQLVVELIQASTAGAAVVSALASQRSESMLNQPDAIKSA